MRDEVAPMDPARIRRLMSDRSLRGFLEQRRNERRAVGSRLGSAIAVVLANRNGSDWAWLDQDRAKHQP